MFRQFRIIKFAMRVIALLSFIIYQVSTTDFQISYYLIQEKKVFPDHLSNLFSVQRYPMIMRYCLRWNVSGFANRLGQISILDNNSTRRHVFCEKRWEQLNSTLPLCQGAKNSVMHRDIISPSSSQLNFDKEYWFKTETRFCSPYKMTFAC